MDELAIVLANTTIQFDSIAETAAGNQNPAANKPVAAGTIYPEQFDGKNLLLLRSIAADFGLLLKSARARPGLAEAG